MSALAALDRALSYLEGMDGVYRDAIKARDELAAVLSANEWKPIAQNGQLPDVGEWAIVLTDREALGRADLNWLHPERPRFAVIPAQLRMVDDGWPTWQRWEMASGHPCGILDGDTHWMPLPQPPEKP